MSNRAQWTSTIKPNAGWLDVDLIGIWNYRDLLLLLVWRDFVTVYKQTVLGPFWFLLQPLATSGVFTVVFGKIAKIPTDGLPPFLFYMAGVVFWSYFSGCLTKTSSTLVSNAGIFGKVYFPRLVVPVSVVITNLFSFFIQFVLFLIVIAFYYYNGTSVHPGYWALLFPLIVLQLAALGLGIGILVSALTTRYRDLTFVLGFGVQLWMYATPIVYPSSMVPEKWQWILMLNPVAAIIETVRFGFLGSGQVNPVNLIVGAIMTLAILTAGILVFSRVERTFMDTV